MNLAAGALLFGRAVWVTDPDVTAILAGAISDLDAERLKAANARLVCVTAKRKDRRKAKEKSRTETRKEGQHLRRNT